ncbi:ArsC family protein [Luminiphilus syltensis NOR5-1B]|uniref:ArsC family protein n=1 Tax=Luminiphilus syltensis NOR5-1B TaxID=565045 RepID=B8KYA6_9GAMM|nr:Spx/MgsR family RNA polymerase-binding regulatory protein [Luminiphilus syltensis]EED36699.1 ArsC family protein [Luminiphilus syltensis NOR5-1B]
MTPVLYGIPNCDTVRKARQWLSQHDIAYQFIDFKSSAPDTAMIEEWLDRAGSDRVINRRSTTWKQLDAGERELIESGNAAAVLQRQPTLIKRPVLITNTTLLVGFKTADYAAEFGV